jgi:hypothetical protein
MPNDIARRDLLVDATTTGLFMITRNLLPISPAVVNFDVANTYKETHDVHAPILGKSQTRLSAFLKRQF